MKLVVLALCLLSVCVQTWASDKVLSVSATCETSWLRGREISCFACCDRSSLSQTGKQACKATCAERMGLVQGNTCGSQVPSYKNETCQECCARQPNSQSGCEPECKSAIAGDFSRECALSMLEGNNPSCDGCCGKNYLSEAGKQECKQMCTTFMVSATIRCAHSVLKMGDPCSVCCPDPDQGCQDSCERFVQNVLQSKCKDLPCDPCVYKYAPDSGGHPDYAERCYQVKDKYYYD